jgi:L-ribulose-5-phosphate 3-epimerase
VKMRTDSGMARREFLSLLGATAAAAVTGSLSSSALAASQASAPESKSHTLNSPFRIAVINDEISQDFGRACEVASQEFGMEWIELRGMWNKNIIDLDAKETAEAQRILQKYALRVTDIASPLFKVDWPGAPLSKFSPKHDQFHAGFGFSQQDEVLERCLEVARAFRTERVRCFDFWRLDNPAPHRAAINEKLRNAAEKAGKQGMLLLLENEPACNTATAAESVRVLNEVKPLMLNWDAANAAASGEIAYPDGYNLLAKDRIAHCHCKDTVKQGKGYDWAAMGRGSVDWAGQFAALKRDGYRYAVSLETHWDGGGTPENSSRQSWAGMKDLLQKAGAL